MNTLMETFCLDVRPDPEQVSSGSVATVLLGGLDVTDKKNRSVILRNQTQIARSSDSLPFGYWEWNTSTGQRSWSDETFQIFGLEPGSAENTLESFMKMVRPVDRERVLAAFSKAFTKGVHYQIEYQIVRPDGTVSTVLEDGGATRDKAGKLTGFVGLIFDITDFGGYSHRSPMSLKPASGFAPLLLDEEKELLGQIHVPWDETTG